MKKIRRRKRETGRKKQTFTAYIICGNRQVIRRDIQASKRFMVEGETYIIKPSCIFLKNIDGLLQSVSYYREGNPNPYSFKEINKGLKDNELDRLYSEDFFHIVTNLQLSSRNKYLLLLVIINFMLCAVILISVIMRG